MCWASVNSVIRRLISAVNAESGTALKSIAGLSSIVCLISVDDGVYQYNNQPANAYFAVFFVVQNHTNLISVWYNSVSDCFVIFLLIYLNTSLFLSLSS